MTTNENTIDTRTNLELFEARDDIKQRLALAINQAYICSMAAADSGFKDMEGGLMLLGELLTEINENVKPYSPRY